MKNISKSAILPIVTIICLGVGTLTGHKIDANLQDNIATWAADLIAVGVSIWGVFHNHKGDVK